MFFNKDKGCFYNKKTKRICIIQGTDKSFKNCEKYEN